MSSKDLEINDNPDNKLAEDRIHLLLIFKLFSILMEMRKCHMKDHSIPTTPREMTKKNKTMENNNNNTPTNKLGPLGIQKVACWILGPASYLS